MHYEYGCISTIIILMYQHLYDSNFKGIDISIILRSLKQSLFSYYW